MTPRRLLVTGLSGLIGGAFRTHVEGKYALRALNRRAVPGVETHQADLGDLAAIRPAFDGVDTVVHLAAAAGDHAGRRRVVQPARHRPDDRGLRRGAAVAALRRLLRRLEPAPRLPRHRPRP